MSLKLRKDGRLSAEDMDNNFLFLANQMDSLVRQLDLVDQKLERMATQAVSKPAMGAAMGGEFGIQIEDGKLNFRIPSINYQGEFNDNKEYKCGDVVWHADAFWILKGDKKYEPGEFEMTNWNCIFRVPKSKINESSTAAQKT